MDELTKPTGNHIAVRVATTARRLSEMRRIFNRDRKKWAETSEVPRDTQELWMKSCIEARTFRGHSSPHVRAAAKAFELVLFLMTTKKEDGITTRVAEELKADMEVLPGRSCMYMDLTSCHLILGVVAAKDGSETRAWFMGRLRRAIQAMRLRGWENPFGFLQRAIEVDAMLLDCLEELEGELCAEDPDGKGLAEPYDH